MRQLVPLTLFLLAVLASSVRAQEPVTGELPLDGLRARCVGPTRGGRVTTVAGVAQRPGEFFMGATGGGVWKTTDFGAHWACVSDGVLGSASIGAIRVAPSDPDVVWVGTGSDGLRSNVISGDGVYRSTDGGKSFVHVGLAGTRHIGAVEVHPNAPEVAFVAAIGDAFAPGVDRGVYRTRDGGRSWDKVLFVSERTGFVDVEFCPADPTVLFAAAWQAERKPWTIDSGGVEGGLWRSTDGGNTWRQLVDCGLPVGLVGKADLAVSAADPTRLYVLIEAPGDRGGVYRSVDGGASFTQMSHASGPRARPFYFTNLDADPRDADVLYAGAVQLYRSTDAGRTWRVLATPHADNHDLWIHPEIRGLMVLGNDGGAAVSRDGGSTWSTQRNQPTAELYQVAVDDRFPYWLYAGQQDNSTIRVPSLPPYPSPVGSTGYWETVGGCETGPAVPKPGDADTVYVACKGRFGVYSARTGQERHYDVGAVNMYGHAPESLQYRFQRVSPILVSRHTPDVIYHASQYVHRTEDEGRTWERVSPDLTAASTTAIGMQGVSGRPITRDITGEEFFSCLYTLAESPAAAGLLWAGSNDGLVYVTRDGGEHWRDVTPPNVDRHGRVQTVEPSPHDPAVAYVCVLRYMLGDWKPYVLRTVDYGSSWTSLGGAETGLPVRCPVRVVREDPERRGLLYLGTDRGLYVSVDVGTTWMRASKLGLPMGTPISDLRVHRGDLVVATMGRGFWIVDDLGPLRQWRGRQATFYEPATAFRMRYKPRRGLVRDPDPGVWLDWWLPEPPKGALQLTVRGPAGRVVRVLSSGPVRERRVPEVPPLPSLERVPDLRSCGWRRLPARVGHNRFRWDMRHPGSWSEDGRSGRGPLVRPGTYELELTVDEVSFQVSLTVAADPRVTAEGVSTEDLEVQESLELRVRDGVSVANQLASRLDESESMRARLVAEKGVAYPQPMLIDQLKYLAGVIGRADQRPGRDAELRAGELLAELDALCREHAAHHGERTLIR